MERETQLPGGKIEVDCALRILNQTGDGQVTEPQLSLISAAGQHQRLTIRAAIEPDNIVIRLQIFSQRWGDGCSRNSSGDEVHGAISNALLYVVPHLLPVNQCQIIDSQEAALEIERAIAFQYQPITSRAHYVVLEMVNRVALAHRICGNHFHDLKFEGIEVLRPQ